MPIQPATKPNPASLGHGTVPKPPESTIEALRAKLLRYDRTPLVEWLLVFMATLPSDEALHNLREKDPLKHVMAMERLMKMFGFVETLEHIHKHSFEEMSDLELVEYLRSARARAPLEITAIDVPEDGGTTPLQTQAAAEPAQHDNVALVRHAEEA